MDGLAEGAAGAAGSAAAGLKELSESFGSSGAGTGTSSGIGGFSVGWIFASMVISAIGFVLLHYGRKMSRIPQVIVGLLMMVYPYFVPSLVPMVVVGAGLCVALWVVVRMGW